MVAFGNEPGSTKSAPLTGNARARQFRSRAARGTADAMPRVAHQQSAAQLIGCQSSIPRQQQSESGHGEGTGLGSQEGVANCDVRTTARKSETLLEGTNRLRPLVLALKLPFIYRTNQLQHARKRRSWWENRNSRGCCWPPRGVGCYHLLHGLHYCDPESWHCMHLVSGRFACPPGSLASDVQQTTPRMPVAMAELWHGACLLDVDSLGRGFGR